MHSSMRAAERVDPAAMPAFQKRMEKFPAPKQYMRWFVTFVTFLKTGCIVAENRCFVKLFQIFWTVDFFYVHLKISLAYCLKTVSTQNECAAFVLHRLSYFIRLVTVQNLLICLVYQIPHDML